MSSKKKSATAEAESLGDAYEAPGQTEDASFNPFDETTSKPAPENGHASRATKPKGGHWRNNVAGVRIEEDKRNKLTTIYFREKAPAEAQDYLLDQNWIKEDDYAFSKKVDPLRTHQHRADADEDVLKVANIVRAEKGLPELTSFYISQQK